MQRIIKALFLLRLVFRKFFEKFTGILWKIFSFFKRVFFEFDFFISEHKTIKPLKIRDLFKIIFKRIGNYNIQNSKIVLKSDLRNHRFTLIAYSFLNSTLKKLFTQDIPFNGNLKFKPLVIKNVNLIIKNNPISILTNFSLKNSTVKVKNCTYNLDLDKNIYEIENAISFIDNQSYYSELLKMKSKI